MKSFFLISILLASLAFPEAIRYPKEVDLFEYTTPQVEKINAWKHTKEHLTHHLKLEKENYFPDETSLVVQFSSYFKEKQVVTNSVLRAYKGKKQILKMNPVAEIPLIQNPHGIESYDYDNNGWKDFKVKFFTGGNAGFANVGYIYYLFIHDDFAELISFAVRDPDYSWEVDIDGDQRYEYLVGHHADKTRKGYAEKKTGEWIPNLFRKYLFINLYEKKEETFNLINTQTKQFPQILVFQGKDIFDIQEDNTFLRRNQIKRIRHYENKREPFRDQKKLTEQ